MTKNTKRKKLSVEEKRQRKEQSDQKREIRTLLKNIGYKRLLYIDGKQFEFDNRTTELDDIFINENVILLTEYTIQKPPKTHFAKKSLIYNKINADKRAFIQLISNESILKSFHEYYHKTLSKKYSYNELEIRILYCSKHNLDTEYKDAVEQVIYFDYHIVQYFRSLSKAIKKSSNYEFLDFLDISSDRFGNNLKSSSVSSTQAFIGNILPEEKSKFDEGYKIVSFYIDAESLLKRAFVLRQNGWKDIQNIGHYQRMLEASKVTSMRKYLHDRNRVFINNIIATISTDKIRLFDKSNNPLTIGSDGSFTNSQSTEVTPTKIEIVDNCNIIGLIDGQHRTYAYHEGDDTYESKIADLRKEQNLLVTGILFPSNESNLSRLKFEANLFLEINSNQKNVPSNIRQEIELMITPFSAVAIGKKILTILNSKGSLAQRIEQYWYEKGKIKTASIVSYGLKPLVKIEDIKSKDSLYLSWDDKDKQKLKTKHNDHLELLEEYTKFCADKIEELLSAIKEHVDNTRWSTYSPGNPSGILTVSFINGIMNVLRLLIENNKLEDRDTYVKKLVGIDTFNFKKYKSSQYRKMGEDIYNTFFK